ncbi:CCR4-NOT transcription complex subunit 10 isoform X3 [Histomonas meleagridis]|uniref:CCR4-NOT transcription complex subunit 10 isoform X3 n=1 Tax=Histomonas meleagridis TaxID=135588 RepID=UPI0035598420|nr:CCR4-NOT transcription complex subunit 10 isoform X3 [Histomonas meleagridis]KAH0796191.1 CCR4-NOT transcription complex subunit 10 isoform X3 [Histomonas meleagridis]
MEKQADIFYQEKYNELLEAWNSEPSEVQDIQNLAIVRYLNDGDSPLTSLQNAEDIIRKEAQICDSWAMHPSWTLIQYHKCLYYFEIGRFEECSIILDKMWKNHSFINKLTLICISLLTYEFAIQTNDFHNVNKANSFFTKEFDNSIQNLSSFLKTTSVNENLSHKIIERYRYSHFRLEISQAIFKRDKKSLDFLSKSINDFEESSEFRNSQKSISLFKLIPLANASLFLEDYPKYDAYISRSTDSNNPIILNNKGLYEIIQKKYSSSLLLFSKALSIRPTPVLIQPYPKILYNIGISLLSKQKPRKAFHYFYSIIDSVPDFPYLWMRLAECCVLFFKLRVAKIRNATQMSDLISRRLSTPTRTYTILPISDAKLFSRYGRYTEGIDSNLTLEFGEKCARNAIALCNDTQTSLKMSANLLCQYICLELGDYERTIDIEKIITDPNAKISPNNSIDTTTKFLSRIYAAQAMYMIRDYKNACSKLKYSLFEVTLKKEYGLMLYQTAWRTFLANNDLEKSFKNMNKAMEIDPNAPEILLTKVAIELQKKRTQQALAILERKLE